MSPVIYHSPPALLMIGLSRTEHGNTMAVRMREGFLCDGDAGVLVRSVEE